MPDQSTPEYTGTYNPGWYPDPHAPKYQERYFNGHAWTEDHRDLPQPSQQPQPQSIAPLGTLNDDPAGALVVIGYITAVVLPIIGFILGIVACTRPHKSTSKHGPWIIVLSIVAFVIWYAIISSAQTAGYSY